MATAAQGGPAALRRAVRELTARWRAEGRYQPASDNWMRGFDPAFSKELSRLGLIGMTWPAEYGGGERSQADRLAVTEELLRAGAPVAAHWIADRQIGPAILRHGSPRLRAEILPGIVAADFIFCLGMSEPEAGSDLASVQTRATADGTGWRLRGRKIWTTGAHLATHAYVLARTSAEADKHAGLTEFIVDMDTPGITVAPIRDLTGQHHFNEVTFDDAAVPAHRVLGQLGNGWRQVVEQLSFERGGPERMLSSYPLLAAALARPGLVSQPGADRELGRLAARLATLRRLAAQVAGLLDGGQAPVRPAATLKYLGNAFEHDLIELIRELDGAAGGTGADDDVVAPLSQAILAAPGFSIRGGAAEVMLSLIERAAEPAATSSEPADGDLRDLIDQLAAREPGQQPGQLPQCWPAIVGLGLPLVGIDTADGGSGGTLGDLVVLVRQLGRHGLSTPLIESGAAWQALAAAQRGPVGTGLALAVAARARPGPDGRLELRLPWGRYCDQLIVATPAGPCYTAPRAALTVGGESATIAGEPRDIVSVRVSDLDELYSREYGGELAAVTRARLDLLRAAAITGAAAGALDMTRGYVSQRVQFGRPLAAIPAVRTALARMSAAVIQGDAAVARAVDAMAGPGAAAELAAAIARLVSAQTATEVARTAHQLHGAIGITAEYGLARYTSRLWSWRDAGTPEAQAAAALGHRVREGGEITLWESITA